jgi:two-component system, chemotaxis family, protein-glutamate methylesterase/glutaminase
LYRLLDLFMTPPAKTVRVLVVDDSAFIRKVLERIFDADDNLQVVGHAKDGHEAVSLAESLKPDVITMDLNMPRMDGLQATAEIMGSNPRPIVIVSSESQEGAASTLRALELGAVDFIGKPSSGADLDLQNIREDLLRKVRMAAKVRVVRTAARSATGGAGTARTRIAPLPAVSSPRLENPGPPGQKFPVVVLVASTGGPATIMRLAPHFTKEFPAAVIVVQHMPATFTRQYATQLAEVTEIPVKEAEHGELLEPGTFYICPGGQHLQISSSGRVQLEQTRGRVNGYLPNMDITMESVAVFAGSQSVAAILTGMGNDGVSGAKAIRQAGGHVLAQDESSCVIFGMPAEAIKAEAVNQVLPLDQIYFALEKHVVGLVRPLTAGVR